MFFFIILFREKILRYFSVQKFFGGAQSISPIRAPL